MLTQEQKIQQNTMVFEDIHSFCQTVSAVGWDVDFSSLGGGEFSTATLFASQYTTLLKGCFGTPLVQRGSTPSNKITFGLVPDLLEPIPWNNYCADHKHLLPFGLGNEFESISQQGFQCITLSFDALHFESLADKLGVHSFQSHISNRVPLALHEATHRELLALIAKSKPHSPASLLDEELATVLLSGLDNSRPDHRRSSIARREKLRRTAVDYIKQNLEEPISIGQLTQLCGCSWKTLERVFKEHYQLNPKQFISSIRLNAVYKDLLTAEPCEKINAIAGRWGYWHMGDFAGDFRKQFGKLPSEVLGKVS
jgi:AraC family transcriptional regulator, ethanolamine operon transcriptional activator